MHSAQPHPDTSVPLNLLEAVNQALRHAMEKPTLVPLELLLTQFLCIVLCH